MATTLPVHEEVAWRLTLPVSHEAFVRAATRLRSVPLIPEIRLHLGDDALALWERAREELRNTETPLPFWAFAWAGGQALARYVLDHPEILRGRDVLDLGAGSGLVTIAAAKGGAVRVRASEIDELAVAAIALNAEANRVAPIGVRGDLLEGDGDGADVVLAGDVFYERRMAERVLPFLERVRSRGAHVLVGDVGRPHLLRERFAALATYDVPTLPTLEDEETKRTTVWRLAWP